MLGASLSGLKVYDLKPVFWILLSWFAILF